MISPALILRLRRNGIVYPVATIRAARANRLGLPLACALTMQESGGGRNVFGHDPSICAGWGTVTKAKYLAYRHLRDKTGKCQGVGSVQLTSKGLQDQADHFGGCWVPQHNMAVGFHYLADLIREHGLHDGVRRYNGDGAAAEHYAEHVLELARHFKARGCGTVVGVY